MIDVREVTKHDGSTVPVDGMSFEVRRGDGMTNLELANRFSPTPLAAAWRAGTDALKPPTTAPGSTR